MKDSRRLDLPGLWQIEHFWKALLSALKTPAKAHALALVLVASHMAWAPSARAASTVKISVGPKADFALAGRLHRTSGEKKAPAVVLMHGCGGWQPPVLDALEDYARFLSSKGIVVLNLDSFGPRGNAGGLVCSSFKRLAAARKYRTQDAFAALRYLQDQPFVDPNNVFLIGQSNGGSVALISAQTSTKRRFAKKRAGFRGIVALYPWCGATGSLRPTLSSPLLILSGGRDDWVPPRDCTRFSSRGESIDVKVYPNAVHSFDVRIPVQRYNGKLVGFNESAAMQARREIIKFIMTHSTHRF